MTNKELQEELARYPEHYRIKVLLSTVMINDCTGDHELILEETDAIEANRVAFDGNYLVIESK